jgi:hypothetical protein
MKNYSFVDNIRFASMACIVWIHCASTILATNVHADNNLTFLFIQPFKFATICFFLISGFLMGTKLPQQGTGKYFKRRLTTVVLPWAAWALFYTFIIFLWGFAKARIQITTAQAFARLLLDYGYNTLFKSVYWFVPNLLLALAIILLCRRFINDLRFGALLLSISMLYGLQLLLIQNPRYYIPHTSALLGFVFYLWLGIWTATHFHQAEARIREFPLWILITLTVFTFAGCYFETRMDARFSADNTLDSLRVFNQGYSVMVAILLARFRSAIAPAMFRVRESTFGIYLTHMIVLLVFLHLYRASSLQALVNSSPHPVVILTITTLLFFALVYFSSLWLTLILVQQPFTRWTIVSKSRSLSAQYAVAAYAGQPEIKLGLEREQL